MSDINRNTQAIIGTKEKTLSFNAKDSVDISDDTFSLKDHGLNTGDIVVYSAGLGLAVAGLSAGDSYYVIKVDSDKFKLATTYANTRPNAETAINLTATGDSSTQTFTIAPSKTFDPRDTDKIEFNPGGGAAETIDYINPGTFSLLDERLNSTDNAIDDTQNTITFTENHGLATGDLVQYRNQKIGTTNNNDIGGLKANTTYYAIVVDSKTIRLAQDANDATNGTAISFTNKGQGVNHGFYRQVLSGNQDKVYYPNHGFSTGDKVVYSNGGGTDWAGLTDGNTYYVVKTDNNFIKLASSAANATAGTSVDLTSVGTGTLHSLRRPTIDLSSDRIRLPGHDLKTGDAITYDPGSGSAIAISGGALAKDTTYYAIVKDANTIELAVSYANATASTPTPIDITTVGSGKEHSFQPSTVKLADNVINLGDHNYDTGDRIIYNNGGGSDIGGLSDSTTYYAIKVDGQNIKLATTSANAKSGTAIDLTGIGTGTAHRFTDNNPDLVVSTGEVIASNGGNITLNAKNTGEIFTASIAGTYASGRDPASAAQPRSSSASEGDAAKKPTGGIGISGDVSINTI